MKAIVTGISGQDGHYAARHLLARGFAVTGLTSDPDKIAGVQAEFGDQPVTIESFDYAAPRAIEAVIERVRPAVILNYAAKSTGTGMFDRAFEMARLNGAFVLDILEAIRAIDPTIGFCQASSAHDALRDPQDRTGSSRDQPRQRRELLAWRPRRAS